MTNPTLEQRAREIALALINERRRYSGFTLHDSLDELQPHQFADQLRYANAILALPTFSHTGVEQAIEACAKVAEEHAASLKPRAKADPKGEFVCGEMYAGVVIATKIRSLPDTSPLPAQSPDDIAYAGAARDKWAPVVCVKCARTISEHWDFPKVCDGFKSQPDAALASLSPDGER